MRPPMSAGPISRYCRCEMAVSRVVWAVAGAGHSVTAGASAAAAVHKRWKRCVVMMTLGVSGKAAAELRLL